MRRAIVGAVMLGLAAACFREPAEPEALAKDLASWMKQVKEWEPEEKRVFQAIAEVTRSQYVHDDFVARTLKDSLPAVRDHIRRIADYRPATAEMEPVVRQYREGWKDLELSFHAIVAAAEAKDYLRLAKAKSQMEYARGEVLGSYASFDELLEANDVQLRALREREKMRGEPETPERNQEPATS